MIAHLFIKWPAFATEGLSPCSQKPEIRPHPEQHEFSSYSLFIRSSKTHSKLSSTCWQEDTNGWYQLHGTWSIHWEIAHLQSAKQKKCHRNRFIAVLTEWYPELLESNLYLRNISHINLTSRTDGPQRILFVSSITITSATWSVRNETPRQALPYFNLMMMMIQVTSIEETSRNHKQIQR